MCNARGVKKCAFQTEKGVILYSSCESNYARSRDLHLSTLTLFANYPFSGCQCASTFLYQFWSFDWTDELALYLAHMLDPRRRTKYCHIEENRGITISINCGGFWVDLDGVSWKLHSNRVFIRSGAKLSKIIWNVLFLKKYLRLISNLSQPPTLIFRWQNDLSWKLWSTVLSLWANCKPLDGEVDF